MLFFAPVCARCHFVQNSLCFRQFFVNFRSREKFRPLFMHLSLRFHSDSNKIWSKFPCYCLIPLLLLLLLLFFVVGAGSAAAAGAAAVAVVIV